MAEGVAAPVVLVIGGTGVFGHLIVADLLTHTTLSVAVASRHGVSPRGWLPGSEGRIASYRLDARNEHAIRSAIEHTRASVVVHAAGPYALIGDAPLRAALGAGIPYVDMCPAPTSLLCCVSGTTRRRKRRDCRASSARPRLAV